MPLIETKRGQDVMGKALHQDLEVKLPFQLPAGQFRTLLGAEMLTLYAMTSLAVQCPKVTTNISTIETTVLAEER